MALTLDEVRTLANINTRAERLLQDGYTISAQSWPGEFAVCKPDGTTYTVVCGDIVKCCDCPAFDKYGTCKHLIAVELKIAEDQWADDTYEVIAAAENSEWGCDPFEF